VSKGPTETWVQHGETPKAIADFERHDALIRQGMCPNGCGLLTEMGSAEFIQSCGTCGFFTNVKPEVTRQ
jgi:hypothetical protein